MPDMCNKVRTAVATNIITHDQIITLTGVIIEPYCMANYYSADHLPHNTPPFEAHLFYNLSTYSSFNTRHATHQSIRTNLNNTRVTAFKSVGKF